MTFDRNVNFVSSDINECISKPCRNGGTCTDKLDGYDCTCANGYAGSACQTSELCEYMRLHDTL